MRAPPRMSSALSSPRLSHSQKISAAGMPDSAACSAPPPFCSSIFCSSARRRESRAEMKTVGTSELSHRTSALVGHPIVVSSVSLCMRLPALATSTATAFARCAVRVLLTKLQPPRTVHRISPGEGCTSTQASTG
eukprot:619709-Rhodomonas_salina.2